MKYMILTLLLITCAWSQDSTDYAFHIRWPARNFIGTVLQHDITYDLLRGDVRVFHKPFCQPERLRINCYLGDGFYQSLKTKWHQGYAIGLDEVKTSDKVKYILLGVAIGAGTYFMISEIGKAR